MGKSYFLNLSLFDDGGSAAPGGGSANAAGTAAPGGNPAESATSAKDGKAAPTVEVIYGKPPAEEAQGQNGASQKQAAESPADGVKDLDAEFDKFIKGDYKAAFEKRMQGALKDRFKRADAESKQLSAAQRVLDAASLRFGTDPNDVDAILKAFDEDKAWLAQRALQNGVNEDVQLQIEHGKRAEAQLARLRQQQQVQGDLNRWMAEGAALQDKYPGLDVLAEVNHPETGSKFLNNLRAGNSVEDTYFMVHKDEILGGLAQMSAQKATEKVTNDIKARGMRPNENGASGAAPARVYKADPSTWDDKDIDRARKEALGGKKILL